MRHEQRELRRRRGRRTSRVALLQAGSLDWWRAHRLFAEVPDVCCVEVGRVLDVLFPHVVATRPWWTASRDEIVRAMGLGAAYRAGAG